MPIEFKEEPPLREVESEIYASRTDLARALGSEPSMKAIATWEHAGLMVSAAPLTWVVMAPTGPHGVHHVTVEAESAAAAKQLLARLMQASPALVERRALEHELWGDDPPASTALRAHIHAVRQTLDKQFDRQMLITLPGIGYRLIDPNAE